MDPLSLYLIGTGVSLGAQAISSGIQNRRGKTEAQKAEDREKELRAQGMPKMETPQEYFELYEAAKENRAADLAIENAQSNMATVTDALQTGGARALLGGLNQVSRQTTGDIYNISAQADQQRLGALETLANAQQRTGQLNTQLGATQYMQDLQGAQAGYQAGRQMQASAIDNFGSTLSTAGGNLASAYVGEAFAEEGMKTPGEFSHEENPIDLVRDGKKIGEATGGEYIFNPDQSKKMRKLAEQEKSPLGKYVVSLLNRFDKKAK